MNPKYCGADVYMSHADAVRFVQTNGMAKFVALMQAEYPHYKLYSCSLDWRNTDQYICKLRGTSGDIIIGWTEDTTHPAYFDIAEV